MESDPNVLVQVAGHFLNEFVCANRHQDTEMNDFSDLDWEENPNVAMTPEFQKGCWEITVQKIFTGDEP